MDPPANRFRSCGCQRGPATVATLRMSRVAFSIVKGAAMSKLMGRHRTAAQRRATLRCGANVLIENVFEACPGHGSSFGIYEQLGRRWSPANRHPGTEVGRIRTGNPRGTSARRLGSCTAKRQATGPTGHGGAASDGDQETPSRRRHQVRDRTSTADRSHLGAPDLEGEGVIHMSSGSIQFPQDLDRSV
jgi:hypothetical protein